MGGRHLRFVELENGGFRKVHVGCCEVVPKSYVVINLSAQFASKFSSFLATFTHWSSQAMMRVRQIRACARTFSRHARPRMLSYLNETAAAFQASSMALFSS